MAGSNYKKASNTAKGAAKKVNTGNRKTSDKEKESFVFQNEVILLVFLAVSVILFLGNFGLAGGIDSGGNWVSNRLRGLFGITEYIFPIVLFVSAGFCIIKGNKQTYKKTAVVYIMMIDLAAMVQLLRGNNFDKLFQQGMDYVFAGGVLGGSIAKLLYSVLGFLGALVVLILVMVGCIVYLTELSFVSGVEKNSRRVYEHTREDMRRRREDYDKRSRKRATRNREDNQEAGRTKVRREYDEGEYEGKEASVRQEELQRMRMEKQHRREEELEARRKKKEKIAKQMAYMEQDRKEREARAKQYEKKEYVNANGMSIVTLEQPKKRNKRLDESKKDIHEVFADEVNEKGMEQPIAYDEENNWQKGAFTINRDGEISEVQVTANEPPKITRQGTADTDSHKASAAKFEQESARHSAEKLPEEQRSSSVGEDVTEQRSSSVEEVITEQRSSSMEKSITEEKLSKENAGSMENAAAPVKMYQKPDISLLKKGNRNGMESDEELTRMGMKLQQTLQSFGVRVTVSNISCGPSVTRYELQPEQGVKVSKIVGLADDIKLNLAVEDIRIEAPIPGKAAVGIEVPNKKKSAVLLGDLLDSKEFKNSKSLLSFAVGKDIAGKTVIHDVAKMPHLLIAGATGSGKSVCSNTLIMSILYKADPDKVKLIMIDPKVVELSVYNGIPHMLIPVVTDPKKAAGALNWAVSEMSERYNKMAVMGVRDVKSYNEKLEKIPDSDEKPAFLPQIVIIVDELADLMMVAKNEVEDAICRLAQLARAAGIHLVIATQRPSVDVITGLIKANMPSRIALKVSSGVDSRTIIDVNGAEKLLGHGDMLFYPSGYPKPVRVQGAFISDDEVHDVVEFLRSQGKCSQYNEEIEEKISQMQKVSVDTGASGNGAESMYDEYFIEAGKFVIEKDKGSIGMLQRMFRIGFNRAARIMDQLEEAGVVGAEEGTKPRKVLMSMEEFESFVEEYV